jgi:hypothetical protein
VPGFLRRKKANAFKAALFFEAMMGSAESPNGRHVGLAVARLFGNPALANPGSERQCQTDLSFLSIAIHVSRD